MAGCKPETMTAERAIQPVPSATEDTHYVESVVRTSGTSFYWAMRLLPAEKRQAMFAIYAFCREVDDIADGDAPDDEKRRGLDAWRRSIDALYANDSRFILLTNRAGDKINI